ncbi:large subunit ribosomal protein L10 [Desulfonauticus submarinus]|uniref:Large ribosomal subunit protein uL10 n=1 Tax=Desulfonauticus submarinus TaxID=206665 RepID=A0A1H0GJH8_9BACT|nr:50S ribosomal protein L10 [Desulfonauticus submarinus]SDO07028.1 large subunit ribosomal protein L10 [Desulfonauticus submarinus]
MKREQKAKIIQELQEKAEQSAIAIVTDFKGLTVEEMTELRVKLREQSVDYKVVKNTLARIAFEKTQHKELAPRFKDNCAVVFGSDDPVVAAKVIVEYAKKNKKFEVKFASLEGKFLESDALKSLAELPSKDELLAKLLGTMNAVPTNFVCLFANLLRNFLYALNAIKDKKEQEA